MKRIRQYVLWFFVGAVASLVSAFFDSVIAAWGSGLLLGGAMVALDREGKGSKHG